MKLVVGGFSTIFFFFFECVASNHIFDLSLCLRLDRIN